MELATAVAARVTLASVGKLPKQIRALAGEAAAPSTVQLRQPIRGGLPPHALRRVREFIEGHLTENITVQMLAAVVRPFTISPRARMAPAPRKPIPDTTCAAIRDGSSTTCS